MNISPLTIYLWQLADKLTAPFSVVAAIMAIISIILLGINIETTAAAAKYAAKIKNPNSEEWLEELKESEACRDTSLKFLKKTLGGFVFSMLISVFAPSSKTIAMMVIIPEIAHSKVVQTELPDIYNAAVKALKDQLAK